MFPFVPLILLLGALPSCPGPPIAAVGAATYLLLLVRLLLWTAGTTEVAGLLLLFNVGPGSCRRLPVPLSYSPWPKGGLRGQIGSVPQTLDWRREAADASSILHRVSFC